MSINYNINNVQSPIEQNEGEPRPSVPRTLGKMAQGRMIVLIIGMCIYFSLKQPRFATFSNALNVTRQFSLLVIFAIAEIFPILGGGFDISIGAIIGMTSVIMAITTLKIGIIAGIICGTLIGGVLGMINGIVISKFKVSPFVATLGMMSAARGLALYIVDGRPIYGVPKGFDYLGAGYIGPFSIPFLVASIVFLASYLILTQTVFGRHIYAVGGNEEAARLSGVNTFTTKMFSYGLCGLISGLGGAVLTSRVNSGQPNLGGGTELEAIAAVVIGGIALSGGKGNIFGVVWGTLVISLLSNGLNLTNVSSYMQMVIIGIVIGLACIIDQYQSQHQ